MPSFASLSKMLEQHQISESTARDEPFELTLGSEFEFILAINSFPHEADPRLSLAGQTMVRQALAEPMVGKCATCGGEHEFLLPLDPTESPSQKYQRWCVTNDHSVEIMPEEYRKLGSNAKYFNFHSIEVTSRILHRNRNLLTNSGSRKDGHLHEIAYEQEIEAVLQHLHKRFIGADRVDTRYASATILVNKSCGLHIHAGNEDRGFPLSTVKNLLSTYVANERAIDALHSVSRIDGTFLAFDPLTVPLSFVESRVLAMEVFNMPLSRHFIENAFYMRRDEAGLNDSEFAIPHLFGSGAYYPESHANSDPTIRHAVTQNDVSAWLEIINCAPGLDELKELQGQRSHSSTLSLQNLATPKASAHSNAQQKNTIEFRQHAGTLEPIEVRAWLNTVVSMISHAQHTPAADFERLCSDEEWLSPRYGTIDLLKAIGCEGKTISHYRHKIGMQGGDSNYARDLLDASREADLRRPGQDPMGPLLKHLADERAMELLPEEVRGRITKKFKAGSYGQFSQEFLNEVDGLDMHLKKKLTIGWKNEDLRPSSSPPRFPS